jgi:pimeloyl-ACP methyl ester carboxylesterase
MVTQSPDDSLPPAAIDSGTYPTVGRCQPPANLLEEVRHYDESAAVGTWSGPRYRMTHRTLGQGPPLLWLPGIASTYRTYALVLNRLAERFRTIQYEYPGDRQGDGARLARITHDHLVDDLIGLMDDLGIARANLAGISFGSTIVLKALQRAPERFSRAVVQGAFAYRRFTAAEHLALFLGRRVPGTVARLPLRQTILAYNSKMDFPRIIEDRWPFYLEENGHTPIRALAHRTSLVARLDLRSSLARVSADILLVQGRDDRIVPHRYFEELKAALPRSESVVMPTVGHIPHITHAESLARVIANWLSPCEPASCTRDPHAGPAACDAGGQDGAPCPARAGTNGSNDQACDSTPVP